MQWFLSLRSTSAVTPQQAPMHLRNTGRSQRSLRANFLRRCSSRRLRTLEGCFTEGTRPDDRAADPRALSHVSVQWVCESRSMGGTPSARTQTVGHTKIGWTGSEEPFDVAVSFCNLGGGEHWRHKAVPIHLCRARVRSDQVEARNPNRLVLIAAAPLCGAGCHDARAGSVEWPNLARHLRVQQTRRSDQPR